MRILLLAGAAAVSLITLPVAVSAQATSADQLNGESMPARATTTTVQSADPNMPDTMVTRYPGNMASVPPAPHKAYPVCSRRLQDSCQNPGEGGAPGRSRALGYWPGRPASEQ
jgi:hypothetical protein